MIIEPKSTAKTDPKGLQVLDEVLRDLIAEHEKLLAVTVEHRTALGRADLPALNSCIQRQNECVQRIAAIERRRAAVMTAHRTETTGKKPADAEQERTTVSAIARAAPEPARSRLLGLGARLRDLLNRLHQEHVGLKLAAETLASHVDGLMRQVCRQLSHTGTYARSGSVDASVTVVSGLDSRG